MVNWKGIIILFLLLSLFIFTAKRRINESYTSNIGTFESDCKECLGSSLEDHENYEDVDMYENDKECKNIDTVENIDDTKQIVATTESDVDNTLILSDTIRRDSKVGSSLEFTYLDETCSKIVNPEKPPFPNTNISIIEPQTPLVKHESKSKCSIPDQKVCEEESMNTFNKDSKKFKSEIFDDSDLKPKPDLDSPYGFVYFPNKYWKQLQRKPPLCTPTSKCKVLPTYTEGTPVNVLDYTQIGSMMPKFNYTEEFEENTC